MKNFFNNKKVNIISDRVWFFGGLCAVAIMVLVTLLSLLLFKTKASQASSMIDGDFNEGYEAYYVMITNDDSSDFWQTVFRGAKANCEEKNIVISFLSDSLEKSYDTYERMSIAINSGVDGIILQADESDRMKKLINKASDAGIPVVTVMEDNSASTRRSFVQVSSFNMGREYGRRVMETLTGEENDIMVILDSAVADNTQNLIYLGLQETLAMSGEQQLNFNAIAIDGRDSFAAEEEIRNIFMEEDTPDVLITLSELSTTCAYQAMIDYNKVGMVTLLGLYDSDTILKGIKQGVINATIAVNSEEMGNYCVEALTEYRQTGYVSEYYSVDTQMITAENVDIMLGGDDER